MEVSRRLIAWSQGPHPYAGWGLCLILIPGFILIPETASGGEWTSVFAASLTTSYEDNPTLSIEDETPNGQLVFNPTLTTLYEEDRYRINVATRVSLVRSADQTVEQDTIRYGSDVDGEYDFETAVVSAAFSLNLDPVRDTEFDDTGQLANVSDVTRTASSLSFGFSQELNDEWRFNVDESFNMVSFSGGDFTDSTNNRFRISFGHDYSDLLTIAPSIGYDRFEPEGGKPSNTYRVNLGGDYALSDVSNAGLTIGGLLTDGGLGLSATAAYDREFEHITILAEATRDVIPSSAGVLRESTRLSSNLTYQYSEMTGAGISTSWRTSSVSGSASSGDTVQMSFSPFINWVLSEDWGVRLTYRERRQQQASAGTARSRTISIVFNYTLPIQ